MIKVALAEDDSLYRKAVVGLFTNYPNLEIIHSAKNGSSLISEIEKTGIIPDIFLLDLRMEILDGIETTKILSQKYEDCKIIILTSVYSSTLAGYMHSLGVSAFLSKMIEPQELIRAIEVVFKNELYVDELYKETSQPTLDYSSRKITKHELTKKEIQILYLVLHGFTNSQIANKMCRSKRTIEGHRQSIMDKTGAKNTVGLVIFGLMNKIIDVNQELIEHNLAIA